MKEHEWAGRGTAAVRALTEQEPQYRPGLFAQGYLITDDKDIQGKEYPFFDVWDTIHIRRWSVWLHPKLDRHVLQVGNLHFLILGHAYDPFQGEYREENLLARCAESYQKGQEELLRCLYDWTGIYVLFCFEKDRILAVQDCGGIKAAYYGVVGGYWYMTSHPQLVADLCGLSMDTQIKKLVSNRFYHIGNRFLLGDLSPFKELNRLGPNHFLLFGDNHEAIIKRFYPMTSHQECQTNEDYERTVRIVGGILHKNIELCLKKWPRAAISMSGGVDSQTTLACANGLYDRLQFFSFYSKETEYRDAQAARAICDRLGLPHRIYKVPECSEDIEGFEKWKTIILHNYGVY